MTILTTMSACMNSSKIERSTATSGGVMTASWRELQMRLSRASPVRDGICPTDFQPRGDLTNIAGESAASLRFIDLTRANVTKLGLVNA